MRLPNSQRRHRQKMVEWTWNDTRRAPRATPGGRRSSRQGGAARPRKPGRTRNIIPCAGVFRGETVDDLTSILEGEPREDLDSQGHPCLPGDPLKRGLGSSRRRGQGSMTWPNRDQSPSTSREAHTDCQRERTAKRGTRGT